MSYTIQYAAPKAEKANRKQKASVLPLVAAVLIPTLIVVTRFDWIGSGDGKAVLFPWEQEYVREAFSDFSESVRTGTDFKEAAEALCRQILNTEDEAQ